MPLELLKTIADKPLPFKVTDPGDVDKLRVLRAAGYVTVLLPAASGDQQSANVLLITDKGRQALDSNQHEAA